MTDFEVRRSSDNLLNRKGKKYIRLVRKGTVDTEAIAKDIAERTGIARSDVKSALDAVSEAMAKYMAMGYSIQLNGIGRFTPKLGWKNDVEPEYESSTSKRNAQSVRFADVKYRTDKELIQQTNLHAKLHRVPFEDQIPIDTTEDDRLKIALNHVKTKGFLKVKEYAALTGLERTRAGKELRQFAEQGILVLNGSGSHIYYTISITTP